MPAARALQPFEVLAPAERNFTSPPRESAVTAVTEDQPEAMVMIGMALWGMGVMAFVLVPMATLAAAPLVLGSLFRRTQSGTRGARLLNVLRHVAGISFRSSAAFRRDAGEHFPEMRVEPGFNVVPGHGLCRPTCL